MKIMYYNNSIGSLRKYLTVVRFQVLTEARMMMTSFWDIAHCSLVEVHQRFRDAYCLHQGDRPDDGGSTNI
jgi:hypothetical protein